MDSLLVLSGVHGVHDAVAAPPEARPTWIARDLRALLEEVESLEPASAALREEWAARDGAADGRRREPARCPRNSPRSPTDSASARAHAE